MEFEKLVIKEYEAKCLAISKNINRKSLKKEIIKNYSLKNNFPIEFLERLYGIHLENHKYSIAKLIIKKG